MPLSTFLDGTNPTRLRGLQWLSLSDTGHVLRGTVADDGGGGVTTGWTLVGTFACRVDPLAGRSRVTGGRIDERSTHLVTVPAGTLVDAGERFVVDGRGTFEVTATWDRTREWAREFEVVAV